MTQVAESFDCVFFGGGYNGDVIGVHGKYTDKLTMRRKDIMKAEGDDIDADSPYAIDETIQFDVHQYDVGGLFYAVAVAEGAEPDHSLVETRAATGMTPL